MRTYAFLEQETADFSKFMVCPHGHGGSIFRDFVQTSFMDSPLLEKQSCIFSTQI